MVKSKGRGREVQRVYKSGCAAANNRRVRVFQFLVIGSGDENP